MLEDAKAFGISSTVVAIVQFVIGASSIAVLNFVAQKQVIETQRYFEKFFRQICKKYIQTLTHTHILCCKNKI